MTDKRREEFEKWLKRNYHGQDANAQWESWQAAWNSAKQGEGNE